MISRKRTIGTVIATLAVLIMVPGVTASQSLRGTIVDTETNEPVANARVLIFKPEGDGIMYGVRADDRGRFDAADAIRDGDFRTGERIVVNIVARGYYLYEERITLPRSSAGDEYRLRPTAGANEGLAVPRPIRISVWLIEASGESDGKADYPKEIEPIVANLTPLFRFSRYRVIGRADVVGMEGSSLSFQSDPEQSDGGRFEAIVEIGFGSSFVKLPMLNVHVMEPLQRSIKTSLNIPDGEIVVLGASSGPATKGSLISVVSARFLSTPGSTDKRDHP